MRNHGTDLFTLHELDLREAIAHYEGWRQDGETVSWIEWSPDLFPKKFGRVQRAILKRSYYIVCFVQEEASTVVLAVLDGRRNPSEIRGIVKRRRKGEPDT